MNPHGCFLAILAVSAVPLLAFFALLRARSRDWLTGVCAGLAAGALGEACLFLHCPLSNAAHILGAHLAAWVVLAACGAALLALFPARILAGRLGATLKRGEFALIDAFVARFVCAGGAVSLGPGDDAALLSPRRGFELALTVDAVVEGVHFTRDFRPEDIGHKALAVNLSNLAAMGARPLAFVCALALPEAWRSRVPRIAAGMSALAERHGVQLAGGNITRARELSATITAIGEVRKGKALLRSGGRAGDRLLVSGELGGAAAGLRSRAPSLRARQRRPTPRVELGLLASRQAHAAIDVSDGLLQDLQHLLVASGVRAELELSRIPVARGVALKDALSGGEDYELLLAAPPRKVAGLIRGALALGVPLHEIGRLVPGRGIAGLGGVWPRGHDHFR